MFLELSDNEENYQQSSIKTVNLVDNDPGLSYFYKSGFGDENLDGNEHFHANADENIDFPDGEIAGTESNRIYY